MLRVCQYMQLQQYNTSSADIYISFFRLQICQYVPIRSVVFGLTSKLSVINKIHWCVARRRLLFAGDGRRIRATSL